MDGFLSMVCPPGSACPLTSGFGLPEVLLWVLTFAITFTALSKLKIMEKKPAALVALALGFFVLMAVPATLITVIAGMSTGFIVLILGAVIVLALFAAVVPSQGITDDKGKTVYVDFLAKHSTATAVVLILVAALIFWTYGGASLIGITSLPSIGTIPWILIIIGIAVLWMLS